MVLLFPTVALLFTTLLLPSPTLAVKHEDFKKCDQSSFCRRLRSLSSRQSLSPSTWTSPYSILTNGALQSFDDSNESSPSIVFGVGSSLYPEAKFELKVDIVGDGIARVRLDEVGGLRQRYDEASKWTLVEGALKGHSFDINTGGETSNITYLSEGRGHTLKLTHSPLKIELFREGQETAEVVVNGRGLLHMEHYRLKAGKEQEEEKENKTSASEGDEFEASAEEEGGAQSVVTSEVDRVWFEGEKEKWEKGMWEETFKSWTDSKPKGPEALSIDVSFPSATHVYGIPEHAAPLSLPSTDGSYFSEPYRLYNVDIFEYEASSPMALYGSVPLLHAHSSSSSSAIFHLSSSETWIDISPPSPSSGISTHWISESGILDLFILPGSTTSPNALFKQFASLVGPPALPAHWALGYHQCRWNYLDQKDVLEVDRRFDADGEGFPLDVTWLDIEYAEEHRYFDWDEGKFPDVKGMLGKVEEKGRKMVAIVDPHIKRTPTFPIYAESLDLDIIVKKPDGKTDYEGWCWTGSSVWVDFFHEKSWGWWRGLFKFDKWTNSAKNLFIWNDMNEPSVFNGPEITMPKDLLHEDGKWEHRDVHNLNGLMFQKQTALGLIERETPAKRPFVLSRAFFAGSQRWGAIWTGDNLGTWAHLEGSFPMLLSLGIAGQTFSGADVGGFFGNPGPDFLVRWYQAGAFMPFFRAHAHIDTKRREPYLLEEPHKSYVRDMIRLRYSLLPAWYTAFREAAVDGVPVLRPHYVQFPKDSQGYAVDDQFFLGRSGLLVKPVVQEEIDQVEIYLSDNQPYYDYHTHTLHPSSPSPRNITYLTPLSTLPLLHQGSTILPLRTRIRRSSPLMWKDPYTLVVALGRDYSAQGELYSDDGDSFGYAEKGEFVWRGFEFAPTSKGTGGVLRNKDLVKQRGGEAAGLSKELEKSYSPSTNAWAEKLRNEGVRVERVVVLGLKGNGPKKVRVGGREVEFEFVKGLEAGGKKGGGKASELVVKDPKVLVGEDWEILFE